MNVPILNPTQRWYCPNCDQTAVTRDAQPHTRYHTCRGLRGLETPFLPAGVKGFHRTVDREDYLGSNQIPTRDGDGRVVAQIITEREEGQDCTVLAPTAVMRMKG